MARPTKRGLDYFPMDCVQDDNLTFIEAKHGMEGFGILIKIWQKIYRNDGYYMYWNEQNMYLFAREIGVNIDVISTVVNTCLLPNISIFDRSLFDKYCILTSTGVQKRWLSIVKSSKRKGVVIEPKFDLLELTPEETLVNPEETPLSPRESTQTKVNDNKEDKTKENDNSEFINQLVEEFGFTEMRFANMQRKVMEFVSVLSHHKRLDHFKSQYQDYKDFKKLSGQISHAFPAFIGNIKEQFEDGAWNMDNWSKKLHNEKLKQNGTKNQSGQNLRSNQQSNGRQAFGEL